MGLDPFRRRTLLARTGTDVLEGRQWSSDDDHRCPRPEASASRSGAKHADQLCDDGESVERRVDLENATVVVTNRRVMTFVPDADGPEFRHAERPNVGTVSVETVDRFRRLCWGIAAAFVGVGLLEASRAVSFVDYVPASGLQDTGPFRDRTLSSASSTARSRRSKRSSWCSTGPFS